MIDHIETLRAAVAILEAVLALGVVYALPRILH